MSGDHEIKLARVLENAVREGAVRALRNRAATQSRNADIGSVSAGEQHPGVLIRSGEAAIAHRLALALSGIADEMEAGGHP